MNARFWIYWNGGVVKVTLRPGESFELHTGRETDEGYAAEWERYSHEGDEVAREWSREGRDCDGLHREGGADSARMDRLSEVFNKYVGISYPDWQESRPTRVYDQFAQAMGY